MLARLNLLNPGRVSGRLCFATKLQRAIIESEGERGAHNYHPLPVVLRRGEGVHVFDVEAKRYMDFLAAYGAVNQGHCHPRIVKSLKRQAEQLTLVSRAFHSEALAEFVHFCTDYFQYERVLPMNSGVEACETAVKLARRWAYDVKKVKENEARVIFANNNFWGRSIAACSASSDPDCYTGFGPFVPNFTSIPFNDVSALEKELKLNGANTAAFMVEPVQGEAGVIIPDDNYLSKVHALCKKYNVLLITDEVQAGLGRCGYLRAAEHDKVKGDIVVLGKALSGGVFPVSAVLSSHEIMLTIGPGQHGSTYGGNPLGCRVATTALEVLRDEKLCENSQKRGEQMLKHLETIKNNNKGIVAKTRGRGLMSALEIHPEVSTRSYGKEGAAWELCLRMAEKGLLAKPTHNTVVRLTPPLCINSQQVDQAANIISDCVRSMSN